jgi:uncharacterized protein YndB with AHSA1/START domain
VKSLCLLGCLPSLVLAADSREIVRKALELDALNSKLTQSYTFLQRQETRELDRSGKVKTRKIETWDITFLEGSPYKRLVARDDQPLSAEEQQREEEKLRWTLEERRKETTEQRERRLAEWGRRQQRQREPFHELLDAFDFAPAVEEQWNGRQTYRIDASPKPGYKPKSSFGAFLPKVKLRLWIDARDLQGARLEIEATDAISFAGVLVRLEKGTRIEVEQVRVNDEVWLPKSVSVSAAARILLVKSLNREMQFTFSDYKKFQADSRVAAYQPVEH